MSKMLEADLLLAAGFGDIPTDVCWDTPPEAPALLSIPENKNRQASGLIFYDPEACSLMESLTQS